MQAIIFIGLQGAGKSTFFKEKFFNTHVRINMDMLKTRHREDLLLRACLEGQQPFVIDKTNSTPEIRESYVRASRQNRFQVVAYYFLPDLKLSLERNAARTGSARVPDVALYATSKKLKPPNRAEGFDRLYTVRQDAAGNFVVEEVESI